MCSGGEADRAAVDGLERRPVAGVGGGKGAGDVEAVHFEMELPPADRGGIHAKVIGAGGGDIDGVLQPFAGLGPADEMAVAGGGGVVDVDARSRCDRRAEDVAGVGVVVGDAVGPVIEVLDLHRVAPLAAMLMWRAGERRAVVGAGGETVKCHAGRHCVVPVAILRPRPARCGTREERARRTVGVGVVADRPRRMRRRGKRIQLPSVAGRRSS